MPLFGIDVSKFNGELNFSSVRAAGVRFAMLKATQGHALSSSHYLFCDTRFKSNAEGFAEVGIPCGAYHFFTASDKNASLREAEYFLKTVRPYRDMLPLYLACDAEVYKNPYLLKLDRNELTELIRIFCERVEADGFKACVYTNTDHIRNYIDISSLDFPVWHAHYISGGEVRRPRESGDKLAIHQYSCDGRLIGLGGSFDLNFGYEPLSRLIISDRTPLEPQTLDYLSAHPNGEGLLSRFAERLVDRTLNPLSSVNTARLASLLRYHCRLSEDETGYMLAYKFADELFLKLYRGMLKVGTH